MCNVDQEQLVTIHQVALTAARNATQSFLASHGDRDCCGFAWVTVYEKGTSKFVRELKKLGFRRACGGGYELWNPSGNHTQALTAKEKGADAYVEVFRKHFPDVTIYSNSRMD